MDSADTAATGPLPIRRLQQSVINRIAAGEIIHRPASALKELIENCFDAGAKSIKVTIKEGGMKLLQIQDDGYGIRKCDLPILAERFTTSKISTFSDLSKLTTYGFRGEALASISYVANMTVTTKTKSDSCAWKACYADGVLVPMKEGASAEPKATAGTNGTTITVENLFYNTPTRLSALRSSAEEYARILDIVTKYAVHNPHVSFTSRKASSTTPDVSTPSGSNVTQAIRHLYGSTIAKDLLHTDITSSNDDDVNDDDPASWSAEAYFTNANYHAKKTVFLLFINHRLVESAAMKKGLEAVYVGVLPKGTSPFLYLSLQLDPRSVDVNVHPTKREVHFLDEEAIIDRICDKVSEALINQSSSRTFEVQTLLTGGAQASRDVKGKGKERQVADEAEEGSGSSSVSTPAIRKVLSQHKVRTSHKDRTLDSMFPVASTLQKEDVEVEASSSQDNVRHNKRKRKADIEESECYLLSVRSLREDLGKGKHQQLTEILQNHIFVGIVDITRCLSLIQHSTKLYLVNHGSLAEELFYQLGLRQFGNFRRIKLDPPPSLQKLIALAVDVEETLQQKEVNKEQVVERIVKLLTNRRDMLSEYFSLDISEDGTIQSIPLLLCDYTPNLDKLPLFLMRLGPQVDWTSECECFESFLRELAYFYVPEPLLPEATPEAEGEDKGKDDKAVAWQIQYALFPAFSRYLVAPKNLLERDVVEVANMPDLYRVFERC